MGKGCGTHIALWMVRNIKDGDDEEAERSDGIFFPRGAEPLSPEGSEHPPSSSQGDTHASAFLVHFPKHGRLAALSRSRTGYFIFV